MFYLNVEAVVISVAAGGAVAGGVPRGVWGPGDGDAPCGAAGVLLPPRRQVWGQQDPARPRRVLPLPQEDAHRRPLLHILRCTVCSCPLLRNILVLTFCMHLFFCLFHSPLLFFSLVLSFSLSPFLFTSLSPFLFTSLSFYGNLGIEDVLHSRPLYLSGNVMSLLIIQIFYTRKTASQLLLPSVMVFCALLPLFHIL